MTEMNGKSLATTEAVPEQRPTGRGYCDTCKFSQLTLANNVGQLWCRRRPPLAIGNAYVNGNALNAWSNTVWPVVTKDDWCGDHEADPRGARSFVANDSVIAQSS